MSSPPSPLSSGKHEKVKRGYRACLHCRSRKAKCDLGDLDAPSSPPCSRCRRESRECIFAPSRRGGNNAKRPKPELFEAPSGSLQDLLSPNPYGPSSSSTNHSVTDKAPDYRARSISPKRRRIHLNPPLHAADPSSIVVADMQNESDALHILAMASAGRNPPSLGSSKKSEHVSALKSFALIKLGIATADQVSTLTDIFFRYYHHLFPMVPSTRVPRTREQLSVFAQNERYLLAAIIIIASRHHPQPGMREVHDKSWAVMRGWLSDIQCLGAPPTIDLVESLLLLAEYLPRDPYRQPTKRNEPDEIHAIGFGEEVHGAENRQAWMLIGMAIRSAYGLGLDKLALKLFSEAERTLELERARLAWTYCYLFDRHVSLRLGKAFWSRGAIVCFQGFSSSGQTGPAASSHNFPFLRETQPGEAHPQEDLASLVQAYIELTQLMSNAHDTLYPNAARTRALVMHGEYFKYIDELARSLDAFKDLWRQKKWTVFPLTDAVWAMFYYTQLYICAFSFQAHVERAAMRADEEYSALERQHQTNGSSASRPALSLFPRGAAASPDARYIFQMCDAARALLGLCVDSLHPGGALPFLPSRYLLWFTYAAIVLLKALYSGAMLRADHAKTLQLIDRLCACLASSSADDDHPAVRYGRQLEALRKKLSSIDSTKSPTGGHAVPLPPMDTEPSPWTFPVPSGSQPAVAFSYETPSTVPQTDANNLGFAALDDWFGPNEDADVFGSLDLQDFWMQVGPGEAQGGFPFR